MRTITRAEQSKRAAAARWKNHTPIDPTILKIRQNTYARDYRKKNLSAVHSWEARYRNKVRGCEPTRPMPAVCECCGQPETWQGKISLCVEHDHETGQFRGWVCHSCNLGIRRLGDNLEGVLKAAAYLRRSAS